MIDIDDDINLDAILGWNWWYNEWLILMMTLIWMIFGWYLGWNWWYNEWLILMMTLIWMQFWGEIDDIWVKLGWNWWFIRV